MPFAPKWTEEASAKYLELEAAASSSLQNRRKANKGKVALGAKAAKASKASKTSKAEGLFKQVEKCVRLLLDNPKHPGLNTHEYDSIENPYDRNGKVFEAYVQNRTPGAYRLFWCYGPGKGEITLIAITPHP